MKRKTLAGLLIAMGLIPSQLAAQEIVADEATTNEALVPPWPVWPGEGQSVRWTDENGAPFTLSVRSVPNIGVDRAEFRAVLAWRAHQRLSLSAEWNPGESELLPNFNFSPSLPGEYLPGVGMVVGTSSDRIGTPDGRAWFGSFTLDPKAWGWEDSPFTGYAGASYGTWANDTRMIGGITASIVPYLSAGVQHDGENVHGVISLQPGLITDEPSRWSLDLLLIEQDNSHTFGFTVSTRF